MPKQNTAVTSSSYTVTEGESSPWIIDSVRAMPDKRLLPQTLLLGAAWEIYCDAYVCVCGRCAARLKHKGTPDRKRPTARKARSGSSADDRNR